MPLTTEMATSAGWDGCSRHHPASAITAASPSWYTQRAAQLAVRCARYDFRYCRRKPNSSTAMTAAPIVCAANAAKTRMLLSGIVFETLVIGTDPGLTLIYATADRQVRKVPNKRQKVVA